MTRKIRRDPRADTYLPLPPGATWPCHACGQPAAWKHKAWPEPGPFSVRYVDNVSFTISTDTAVVPVLCARCVDELRELVR